MIGGFSGLGGHGHGGGMSTMRAGGAGMGYGGAGMSVAGGGPAVMAGGARLGHGAVSPGSCGTCAGGTNTLVSTVGGGIGTVPAGTYIAGDGDGCGIGGCSLGGAGCLVGEECGGGTGMMTFVGAGGGDFKTETTYKYVGAGQGDILFITQRRKTYYGLAAFLALLALAAVVISLCTGTSSTTVLQTLLTASSTTSEIRGVPPPQTTIAPAAPRLCMFWGDPHVVTFDGSRPSFYGDGEFWIVKNAQVSIQGVYRGTQYTYGLAATHKVAIGGAFIGNHIIQVDVMENDGKITIDGREICKNLGTTYEHENPNFPFTVVQDDVGVLPDKAASVFKRHIVHIKLPMGIKMTVFRWTNYMDLTIEMQPLPGGQDGSCGNFNGDPSDDTTPLIFERVGVRVADGELLFPSRSPDSWSFEEAEMLKTCDSFTFANAKAKCNSEMKGLGTAIQIKDCTFDQCFGMNEHALRAARTFANAADKAAAGETSVTA